MIDEELYQKATDELNSEHRRPHIWARACALANDDHDEARYLYTNLRVEELLGEVGKAAPVDTDTPDPAPDRDLSLEPLPFEELPPVGDGTVSSIAAGQSGVPGPLLPGALDDGTLRPGSVPERMALELDDETTLDVSAIDETDTSDGDTSEGDTSDGDGPDGEAPPAGDVASGTPTGAAVSDDVADAFEETFAEAPVDERDGGAPDAVAGAPDDEPDADPAPAEPTDGLDELFASVRAAQERADDRPDVTAALATMSAFSKRDKRDAPDPADDSVIETIEADEVGIDDTIALDPDRRPTPDDPPRGMDDLDWLDEAYRAERQSLDAPSRDRPELEDGSDALTRELRRQAEELPGSGRDAVIAHEPHDTLPTRRVGRDIDTGEGDAGTRDPSAPGVDAYTATTSIDDDDDEPFVVAADQPLELADERAGDTEFAVFAAPTPGKRPQTVRQGSSWGALVATLPWLLYRHLFGTAIVYALFAAAVILGLAVTGLAWYDAGDAATFATKSAVIGFALLAFVGLLVVPFRSANHWREDKLERRGFELVAYVRAARPERAIELARQASDRLA